MLVAVVLFSCTAIGCKTYSASSLASDLGEEILTIVNLDLLITEQEDTPHIVDVR